VRVLALFVGTLPQKLTPTSLDTGSHGLYSRTIIIALIIKVFVRAMLIFYAAF
jgi:hypothetical protein